MVTDNSLRIHGGLINSYGKPILGGLAAVLLGSLGCLAVEPALGVGRLDWVSMATKRKEGRIKHTW